MERKILTACSAESEHPGAELNLAYIQILVHS